MPLRNATPVSFIPHTVCDSVDPTNTSRGAMSSLQNLVPDPTTRGIFVPRPASIRVNDLSAFVDPHQGESVLLVGSRIYGLLQTGRFPGRSEPFVFDTSLDAFVPIDGVTGSNIPVSISPIGDWVPPAASQIGPRVLFTHPGFTLPNAFGWLDMTGFSDVTKTGNTHATKTIDTLSSNVLQAGWQPGMVITDSAGDIPSETTIVSIASNGLSVVISQAATGSNAVTLSVFGGSFGNPLWAAGNVNIHPLIAVPTAVAQFNGRAYFGVENAVVFSDSGLPLNATNATQAITFLNGLDVTAIQGSSIYQTTGGALQALYVFQGAGSIQQITGDASLNNLSVNEVTQSTGTLAPNSIVQTPRAMLFMAHDGLRSIDNTGNVGDVIGLGDGVVNPFLNVVNPSRMCAAYDEDVYRISFSGSVLSGGVTQGTVTRQEYWYHLARKIWTGPHSFAADVIGASQTSGGFFLFPSDVIGLFSSTAIPTVDSTYTENGAVISCVYKTGLMPDSGSMAENAILQTALFCEFPEDDVVTIRVLNEYGLVLDQITLPPIGGASSLWGTMIWGRGLWGGRSGLLGQRWLEWTKSLVFKQCVYEISFGGSAGVRIGNLYMLYQRLGYLMQAQLTGV